MGSCKENSDNSEENKKRKFLGQSPLVTTCSSGAALDFDAYDDEMPQHKVRISKGFFMGTYEVTVGQFKTYIAGTGRDSLLSDDFIKANSHGDRCAVSTVSWNDAQGFVTWLNGKERGKKYRLPTEAEWEYACRAGTTTRYHFGDSPGDLGDYAWYTGNAYDRGERYAHTVGMKQPNPWGLYDMHGNVFECCQDWYGEEYAQTSAIDPKGPNKGSGRVHRGGSWCNPPKHLRSAYRYAGGPDLRSSHIGFRLVLLPGQ